MGRWCFPGHGGHHGGVHHAQAIEAENLELAVDYGADGAGRGGVVLGLGGPAGVREQVGVAVRGRDVEGPVMTLRIAGWPLISRAAHRPAMMLRRSSSDWR